MKPGQTIKTDERIFKIITRDKVLILANLGQLQLEDLENIKALWHFWNGEFQRFSKIELKEMIINSELNYGHL